MVKNLSYIKIYNAIVIIDKINEDNNEVSTDESKDKLKNIKNRGVKSKILLGQ